jgi:hypothetical protein
MVADPNSQVVRRSARDDERNERYQQLKLEALGPGGVPGAVPGAPGLVPGAPGLVPGAPGLVPGAAPSGPVPRGGS